MSLPTQPTEIPQWATDGGAVVTTPTSPKQGTGWVVTTPAEKPPVGIFNWLAKWTYLWIVYARDSIADLNSRLVALTAGVLLRDGSVDVAGILKPATTATYDLGTPSKKYKDAYLSGNVSSDASLARVLSIDEDGGFGGDLSVTGAVSSDGGFKPTDSDGAATPPPVDTLRRRLLPRAWGMLKTVSGSPLLVAGANMQAPALTGSSGSQILRVNLATPMVDANYAVGVSSMSGAAVVQCNGKFTDHFFLAAYDFTGAVIGFDNHDIIVDVIVFGRQS